MDKGHGKVSEQPDDTSSVEVTPKKERSLSDYALAMKSARRQA